MLRGRIGAVALVATALAAAGCAGGSDEIAQATAPAVSVPSTIVATPRRPSPRIDTGPGTVRVEEGPFTDRVTLTGLRFVTGARPSVMGRLNNTVDVSELIVLELQADFYDEAGRLVGTGRQVFEDALAGPDEPGLDFSIRAPARIASEVSAAVLSIPQLVNE